MDLERYTIILEKQRIVRNLLMSTCEDLDRYRNVESKTDRDREMMNFILTVRKPLESWSEELEMLREHEWNK